MAANVSKIVVARGATVVTIEMTSERPDDQTLAAHLLGPSGNLRAPTIRKGQTLLVGFNDKQYTEAIC